MSRENISNKLMILGSDRKNQQNSVHQQKKQGSTNWTHGDERAHNVHAKKFSHARIYVHINQSKHL